MGSRYLKCAIFVIIGGIWFIYFVRNIGWATFYSITMSVLAFTIFITFPFVSSVRRRVIVISIILNCMSVITVGILLLSFPHIRVLVVLGSGHIEASVLERLSARGPKSISTKI